MRKDLIPLAVDELEKAKDTLLAVLTWIADDNEDSDTEKEV